MSALNKLPIEVKRKEDGGSFLIEGSSWSRYGNYFFLCVIPGSERSSRWPNEIANKLKENRICSVREKAKRN